MSAAKKRIEVHERKFGFRVKVVDANWSTVSKLCRLVRDRIGENELTYARVGGDANVGPATVSRLARGLTKYPRFKTLVGTMTALGLEVTISEP